MRTHAYSSYRSKAGPFLTILLGLCLIAGASGGAETPADYEPPEMPEPYATLEDLEDVRLLFSLSAYRIHRLDTLLRYGRGFGIEEFDPKEARRWHLRSLRLFERLKSADDGGQGLAALGDFRRIEGDQAPDMTVLRKATDDVAKSTLEFYSALNRRLDEVRARVETAATDAGRRPPEKRRAISWEAPHREAGRRTGFMPAWFVWMNQKPDSRRAALDRQQGLDPDFILHKARKLGIRGILPEFKGHANEESVSWRVVETEEGEYDFSRIDANIERITRHGLKTIVPVRSLDTRPPGWAEERFGKESRLWKFGKDGGHQPTMGVNLLDPETRASFAAYLEALCTHLAENHRPHLGAIALEVSAMSLPRNIDYSPAARTHFQRWLRDSYGDIAALNDRWEADYESFSHVDIPAPRGDAPHLRGPNNPDGAYLSEGAKWHDWIQWRKAWVAEYFRIQAEIVRRHLPGVPIQAYAISANSHHAHSERPVASWPTERMGGIVDFPSSAATSEPIHALMRAVGDGRFGGQQAEQNFGSMLGGAAYTALLKDTLFTIARNGPEMILRYFYSGGLYVYMDRQMGWDGAYGYRLKMREMHRLAPIIENTRAASSSVAVLWSADSYDQDPTRYSRYGALGTAYALMNAKVQYDIILDSDVPDLSAGDYQVVIVPEQRFLSEAVLAGLRRYVREGGTLYATGVPGMFDPFGRPRMKDGRHPLADVFGVDVKRFIPIQAVLNTFLVPTRPHAVWDERERGARWHRRGHIFYPEQWTLHRRLAASFDPHDGAEVMHRFADGDPAMVRHKFGEGTAVIFGYPFGHEFAFSNTTEMSFGKLYPHYAYPTQMLNLHRWLGRFVREELGVDQAVQVPRSRMMRFTGTEASGPTMTYPSISESYQDKRDHTEGPNHSFNVGLRTREGVDTTYLTVFNRDSAYAYGRGYIHYMASPTYAVVRINRTDVTAVYDVLNGVHVPFVRGDMSGRADREGNYPDADECISFEAVVPSYFGGLYAIATDDRRVEIFEDRRPSGVPDEVLAERVETLAQPWDQPEVLVLEEAAIERWLVDRREKQPEQAIHISYGSMDYVGAAARLAEALRRRGFEVRSTPLELQHRSPNPDPYYSHRRQRYRRPTERIDVFIGNEHTNSNLADLTAAWQATEHANPRQHLSVNREFPGGDRAVLQLTYPFHVRRPRRRRRKKGFPATYHDFRPHPRELIVGASSPEGAERGVEALLKLWER